LEKLFGIYVFLNPQINKKKCMNEIATNINAHQTEIPKRSKGLLIVSGIIILAILGVIGFFFFNNPNTKLNLFTENFKPLPDVIINRAEEENDLLTIGMAAYSHQDYIVAALHLEQFVNRENSSETNKRNAFIYIGVAHLAIGNVNTAIQKFDKITQENPLFRESAEWYLALTYLKKGNFENCEKQLKIIQSNPQHQYRLEAEKLLKKVIALKKS
jgi:tetratricopeptide (TPR) repeat protein